MIETKQKHYTESDAVNSSVGRIGVIPAEIGGKNNKQNQTTTKTKQKHDTAAVNAGVEGMGVIPAVIGNIGLQ